MKKIAELKEIIKGLSPEELEELKTFLVTEEKSETEKNEELTNQKSDETEPETAKETEEPKKPDEQTTETATDETAMDTELEEPKNPKEPEQDEPVSEEEQSENDEGVKETEELDQVEPVHEAKEDSATLMQRVSSNKEKEPKPESLGDAQTSEHVDYEKIVDGLNARITALETENASLKSRVEGAFGYSSKPIQPVKTNRLFDECDDFHLRK